MPEQMQDSNSGFDQHKPEDLDLFADRLREECGVFGILGHPDAAAITALGLHALMRLAEVFILFRMLPYNLSFVKPLTAGFAALLAALGTNMLLPVATHPVYAIIHSTVLLGVYVGLIVALGLSQEDRVVLARLRARLSKGKGRKR